MPTKNPRLNITFEPATVQVLLALAKLESKSISGLAKELILEALDRREDMLLSKVAADRDTGNRKTVKLQDAWK